MYLNLNCDKCNQQLTVPEEYAGRRVRCPACQTTLLVPAIPQEPDQAADPLQGLADVARSEPKRSSRARATGAPAQQRPAGSTNDATNVNPLVTALIGFGLTVVFYLILMVLRGTYFWSLFCDRGWVTVAEAFLFFWSIVILVFKWRKLIRQRQSMLLDLLPQSISPEISIDKLEDFTNHVRALPAASGQSFLVNRVLRGLQHFRVRRSASEVASILSSQSEIDGVAVDSSYTLIKVFIWAIPILGFIGTVQGLGDAVGGFSGKMAGATDIAVVKDSLGDITKGLGVAFDTTLIALVMSLLLMFPMSALQNSEEDLLNWVDEYCNENLLKRLDDSGASAGGNDPQSLAKAIHLAMAGHRADMAAWTRKLEGVGEVLTKQLAAAWEAIGKMHQAERAAQLKQIDETTSKLLALDVKLTSAVEQRTAVQQQTENRLKKEIEATHTHLALARDAVRALNDVLEELDGKQVVIKTQRSRKSWWPFGANGA